VSSPYIDQFIDSHPDNNGFFKCPWALFFTKVEPKLNSGGSFARRLKIKKFYFRIKIMPDIVPRGTFTCPGGPSG
jgi:hypothetical protein